MPQPVIRRAIPYAAALVCSTALAVPALAAAASGSGGAGFPSASSGGPQAASPTAQPGNVTVSAAGDGMTISTTASAILRHGLAVSGTLPTADAGRTLELEVSGLKTHWIWQPVATAQVQSNGTFVAVWQTNHIGRFSIRVVTGSSGAASASASAPTVNVIVYRPSLATLYGPGFYGRRTACGVVLRRSTVGLANRTLPCGTPVAIDYQGQTLIVPVIDRGPYAHQADWDLTMATGRALGMTGTAMLGATSLPFSH
jgi:rare lipoprotein A